MVRIRHFREDDTEALLEITCASFKPVSIDANIEARFGPVAGHDWQWRKRRHIDADIAANAGGIFVAEEDGRVVGYVTTRIDREGGVGGIPNLAVSAAVRGRGIGRQLLERAIAYFREEGMEVARIETLEQNEIGRAFYPTLGFEEVARQVHFAMSLRDAEPAGD